MAPQLNMSEYNLYHLIKI